jgi:hypothetical protein
MIKTFYAVVCQHDMNAEDARVRGYDPPEGPILLERYLNNESAQSEELTREVAKQFGRMGWTRVATITVDIPEE